MVSESMIIKKVKAAKAAAEKMVTVDSAQKNTLLRRMSRALKKNAEYLIQENRKDIAFAEKQGYSSALIDRLRLNDARIKAMAECLNETAALDDPVGEQIASFKRPNGLLIKKVRVPIGVIGIIYESRPNVTSDCIGLCIKSGNAVVLKGGKEASFSNKAIFLVLREEILSSKLPAGCIQLMPSTDRESVGFLLKQDKYVDMIIPRGGEGLIRFVSQNSTIPVIKHYKGICHTYVSDKADLSMAASICFNAKVQRPGVCNAMETMLVHSKIADRFLPEMIKQFQEAGVEIRGCMRTRKIVKKGVKRALAKDWDEEYLDLVLSVKVVDSLQEAVDHINTHGSHHSDAIITRDKREAEVFLQSVDSSSVYVNASTRFTDGYQFGFGAEIGISTDKLHARGPMGLRELTTYKYIIYGNGQIRQ